MCLKSAACEAVVTEQPPLALLFAACTAVVPLFAGVLFSRGSEVHFIELDQQLLEGKLIGLRRALQDLDAERDPGPPGG